MPHPTGVSSWDGRVIKAFNERSGMGTCTYEVKEWVKMNALRRFGHIKRMMNKEFVKSV